MNEGRARKSVLFALILLLLISPEVAAECSTSTSYFPDGYSPDYRFDGDEQCPQWKKTVDLQWMDWGETKKVGNSIVGEYTVEVSEFQVDETKREVEGVLVNIYDRETDEVVAQGFHREGRSSNYINYRDDVRVKITQVRDAEEGDDGTKFEREEVRAQAKLFVEIRAQPNPKTTNVEFSEEEDFDKKTDDIFSATEFWTRVKFKNSGNAKLFETSFDVNVTGFDVLEVKDSSGELDENDYTLEDGHLEMDYGEVDSTPDDFFASDETYTLKLKLEAPKVLQERKIPVEGSLRGVDLKGREYTGSDSEKMKVFAVVHVYKSISPDVNPDTDQFEMYIGQDFTVTLRVRNFAETPVTINSLTDSVPSQFALLANQSTSWRGFEVGSESTKAFTYKVMPRETGTVSMPNPQANFTWREPGVASSALTVEKVVIGSGTTHGPLVVVEKTISPSTLEENETATVTIEVRNEGDRTAQVSLNDAEPDSVEPLGPVPSMSRLLKSGESFEETYEVKATRAGEFELPEAEVTYADIVGTEWQVFSGRPTLTVENATKTEDEGNGEGGDTGGEDTPQPTDTPVVTGPGPLAALLLAAAALKRR